MSSQSSPNALSLRLKEPTGWFAAGTSFRRALQMLSDGAFKLFAHLCLEANRQTGRLEASQAELGKAIGKSRRIVGKYIEELQGKQVCSVSSAKNQYGRTSFEISNEYWPYCRTMPANDRQAQADDSYMEAIKTRFTHFGCTVGKFSIRDAQFARVLQRRGVPLETVQDAMLIGAARKFVSWLNSGQSQPITTLAYFAAVISEIQERPFSAGYREYLERKVVQLTKAWVQESMKQPTNGTCLHNICLAARSFNSDHPTRPLSRQSAASRGFTSLGAVLAKKSNKQKNIKETR